MSNIQDSINLLVTEGTIEPYTFILATANHNHLGQIVCLDDKSIKVEVHSNQADKITFTTYKYYQNDNGELVEQPFWNEIQPLKYMYCVELDEYFIIDVELSDEHSEIKISKTITATSQCEVELSNKKIYDLEVNTENDYMIADTNNLYYTTYFYKPSNPNLSLLHRVLNFAPAYSIGTIDDSLLEAFETDIRSFSVSSSTVYDFLTGDVANEFHCIFEFDTVNRVINVHDLYSTCKSCGYYGEFQAQCPNCGSINIDTYGTETTIFVNTRNLTDQVQFVTNTDNIKNCFKLTAGDDLMNVAIRELNPSGSNYIYHITDDIKKDFSDSLKEKLSAYDLLYTDTVNNAPLGLDSNIRTQYNNTVSKYQSHYKEYYKNSFNEYVKVINTINDTDKGTDIIAQYYAEAIEFNNFLQSAMLPSAVTSDVTSNGEKERLESAIDNGKFNAVGLPSNSVSQLILENAVKNYAKLYVRSGYMKMEIKTTAFDVNNLTWNGYIIITNYSDESDTSTTKKFSTNFTKDYATYLTQKAQKDIADAYKKDNTYFDVFGIEENSKFATALTLYNSDTLINIYNSYESAMTVLATSDNSGLNEIKNKYQNRLELISKEVAIRENECNIVSYTYSLLSNRLNQIHDILSIQNYLGKDLYEEFTLYIREDEYSNTNFVSDSLTNPMVSSQAKLFLETANKELIKASTPQRTINTSIKNLALIPEFKPYITDFALNNWIRVECDGIVYRLRLIGFSIDFGTLSDISVEFSDLTIAPGFISDMQSLLQQASSMAGTYDYTVKQAEKGYQSNTTITDWIKEGLNSAEVVLKNNDNEEITTTRSGILGRAYDDITEDYDRCQFRLTHNMFAFTNNHWKPGSVISALGEHNYTYWDGAKFATATDYGLTTQFVQSGHIVGGQIIGSELLSSNWNGNNVGTYINLDKNVVKLGNKLVFENNKLTFGSDVTLSWSNIPTDVASQKYATDVASKAANKAVGSIDYTQITKEYVLTPELYANNLHVQSANIDGAINCDKLNGGTINGQNINGGTISGTTITGASGNFTKGFLVDIPIEGTEDSKYYCSMSDKIIKMGFTAKEGTADGYIKFDNSNGRGQCFISINGHYFSYNGSEVATVDGTVNNAWHCINDESYMSFHWSGKDGQPSWLWGGNDSEDMYVYNPANFSVNYANSAGSANSLNSANSYSMQSLELSFSTPFIDFHYNNSTADYTTRLIEDIEGRLSCYGNFKTTGQLRSKGSYDTTTSAAPNCHIANDSYDNSIYRSTSSSKRYKFDICNADMSEIRKLYNLPIRKYKYKLDYLSNFDERYNKDIYGFIAEELDELMPIAVNHNQDGSAEMWNSNIIIPCLLGLIQDLNSRLDKIEKGENR